MIIYFTFTDLTPVQEVPTREITYLLRHQWSAMCLNNILNRNLEEFVRHFHAWLHPEHWHAHPSMPFAKGHRCLCRDSREFPWIPELRQLLSTVAAESPRTEQWVQGKVGICTWLFAFWQWRFCFAIYRGSYLTFMKFQWAKEECFATNCLAKISSPLLGSSFWPVWKNWLWLSIHLLILYFIA